MGDPRFESLRQAGVPGKSVDALEKHVAQAGDADLVRVNAIAFSQEYGLSEEQSIFVTRPVLDSAPELLVGRNVRERRAQLKGVSDEMTVFEIP